MFQKSLREHFDKVLLTYRDSNYTGGSILRRVYTYTKLFKDLQVNSNNIVGIYTDNPAHACALVMACMCYGVNFAIFDPNENRNEVLAKAFITDQSSYNWLMFSEFVIDNTFNNFMTISPSTLSVLSKGIAYRDFPEDVQREFDDMYNHYPYLVKDEDRMSKKMITLPINYLKAEATKLLGIVYHDGISKGVFNAAKFPHSSIYKGLYNIIEHEEFPIKGPILCVETFGLLYNLTNGLLYPMLIGVRVVYIRESDYYSIVQSSGTTKIRTLYSSANKLEYMLRVLEKDTIPLLRWWIFKPILNYVIKSKIRNIFTSSLKECIIYGKTYRRDLINAMGKPVTVLYTMTEVTTYIASKNFKRLPKRIGLLPRKDVKVEVNHKNDEDFGEITVYADDMFISYLTGLDTAEALLKDRKTLGKLSTGDIGYFKSKFLFVMDKATQIFSNNKGKTIETDKIKKIAQNFDFVKTVHVINVKGSLTVVIEPDFEIIENRKMSPQSVYNRLDNIKLFINKELRTVSAVEDVIMYDDPKGLPRKNAKIISRYFG